MCKLCDLLKGHSFINKYYEDSDLLMVDCRDCFMPVLLSKKHEVDIDISIAEMSYYLFYKYAKRFDMSNWHVDNTMEDFPEHWHVHLRRN